MKAYFVRHLQVLFATLGNMRRSPVASITTIVIIGISLLLPMILYITVKSGAQLTESWHGQPQMSVFLKPDLADNEATLIFDELRLHPKISLAEFVTPGQALEEFRAISGLEMELDFLDENPLPASIVILPITFAQNSNELSLLRDELVKIDGIDEIRLDLEWTDRFNSILGNINRAAQLLSALLAIALILITGNTIKLLIMNRQQEIEITKLVGGSNRFVRRPFLYFGALYGFLGALVTLFLLAIAASVLHEPLSELAQLYQQSSLIYQPSLREFGLLMLFSTSLGWCAARLSVAQHLGEIKPQ